MGEAVVVAGEVIMMVTRTGGEVTRTTGVIGKITMVVITTATGGGEDTEGVGVEGVRTVTTEVTEGRDRTVESSSGKLHRVRYYEYCRRTDKEGI